MSDVEEFNPPEGWEPPTPPTAADEARLLREAFGEPVRGVYAPLVAPPSPLPPPPALPSAPLTPQPVLAPKPKWGKS